MMLQVLVHFSVSLHNLMPAFLHQIPGMVTNSMNDSFFILPQTALRATLGLDTGTVQAMVDQTNIVQQVNPSFDQQRTASI